MAISRYRSDLGDVAERLLEIRALQAGQSAADANDLLWCYVGFGSMCIFTDDVGWSPERAEKFLTDAVIRDLIN